MMMILLPVTTILVIIITVVIVIALLLAGLVEPFRLALASADVGAKSKAHLSCIRTFVGPREDCHGEALWPS